jgi:hypothetical protein
MENGWSEIKGKPQMNQWIDLKLEQTWDPDNKTWDPIVEKEDTDKILGVTRYRAYNSDGIRTLYIWHNYTPEQLSAMKQLGFVKHDDF